MLIFLLTFISPLHEYLFISCYYLLALGLYHRAGYSRKKSVQKLEVTEIQPPITNKTDTSDDTINMLSMNLKIIEIQIYSLRGIII